MVCQAKGKNKEQSPGPGADLDAKRNGRHVRLQQQAADQAEDDQQFEELKSQHYKQVALLLAIVTEARESKRICLGVATVVVAPVMSATPASIAVSTVGCCTCSASRQTPAIPTIPVDMSLSLFTLFMI